MNNWISVKDRLPEEHKSVLVYSAMRLSILKAKILHGKWVVYYSDGFQDAPNGGEITHWMPLPEPPQN